MYKLPYQLKTCQNESRLIPFIKWSLGWWAYFWPISKAQFKKEFIKISQASRPSFLSEQVGNPRTEAVALWRTRPLVVLQWKKEKKISWCQPAKTLARRRQDALSGDNEHGREPRTPNLIKKFTPKKRTINTESLCEQWCSLHPKLNCHRVPTSPTAHNGLMTDMGHLSEFHKEGFQNRLQKIWVLILQENKLLVMV